MRLVSDKKPIKKVLLKLDKFQGGSNYLIDEARMGQQYAVEAVNMIQDQDGIWKTKWGSQVFGAEYALNPDGASEFVKSDNTTELVVIANGKAWKSTDGGAITEITGATFTAGLQCYFMQIAGFLYIANGTDTLARYNGSTLVTYTEINAPANLSASRTASGLASGTYTYYGEVTALNAVGETVGSTEFSINCNKDRDSWTAATDKIQWSWNTVSGATAYQLYLSDTSGYENLLTSITAPTLTFIDDGSTAINEYVTPPLLNTTGAPKFKSMCISGNRIWATNNTDSRYTVYFSGTGTFLGNFSDFYGGGWINLEKGGREIPVCVKHYQTGQGVGTPTVLCSTPDGKGSVWQLDIATATVGTTSFSIPSATKIVGSFGTESILGVVGTTNDITFPNRKGWFSLGLKTGFYNILRTSELSSIIRPYWRNLISSKLSGICAYYYDAKIFISVPTSTVGNDRIIIYDTERNNWAVDWTNGARQFLDYTSTDGNTHFLYIPTSGTKLIELSPNFQNDQGVAFNQSYISPLISVSDNKTDIFAHQQSVLELGRPKGSINFQILGVGKDTSFSTVASATITNFGSNTGVGSDLASAQLASTTNSSVKRETVTAGSFVTDEVYLILTSGTTDFTEIGAANSNPGTFFTATGAGTGTGTATHWVVYLLASPSSFAQSTTRKAIKKNARLYAIQFKVASTSADTNYSILNIQSGGTIIPRKIPSQWLN